MRAARAGRRIVMRPTEHGFVGPLAGELEEYIRFKASMGRHGATRVQVLRSFDRHCLEHGAVRLERGVVERWIAHRIDANPGGCRSWFSYIRDFGRWMRLAHDPDAYVLSDQGKAGSPRPTPYLCFASIFLKQFLHYFSAAWAAGFQQELHHMTAQTRTGTGPPCLYIPET